MQGTYPIHVGFLSLAQAQFIVSLACHRAKALSLRIKTPRSSIVVRHRHRTKRPAGIRETASKALSAFLADSEHHKAESAAYTHLLGRCICADPPIRTSHDPLVIAVSRSSTLRMGAEILPRCQATNRSHFTIESAIGRKTTPGACVFVEY